MTRTEDEKLTLDYAIKALGEAYDAMNYFCWKDEPAGSIGRDAMAHCLRGQRRVQKLLWQKAVG